MFNDNIGCSLLDFKKHIENQFTENMTWGNYGIAWEYDHIKPCAVFDLTDIKQRKECFNYMNIRPLIISRNRIKSKIVSLH